MSPDDLALYIWLGVAGALALAGMTAAGYVSHKDRDFFDGDVEFTVIIGAIACVAWPLILACAVASLPFWLGRGLAVLSDRREAKQVRQERDKKEALFTLRNTFDRSEPEWALLDNALKET